MGLISEVIYLLMKVMETLSGWKIWDSELAEMKEMRRKATQMGRLQTDSYLGISKVLKKWEKY